MSAVTVGLPVHNGRQFLEEALKSLSRQTFQDFQVIISDDASADLTPEIAQAWASKDPRFLYFRQEHPLGETENLAWVVAKAQSPWFMVAAHDDKWSPEYIETLHAAATAKPGVVSAAPRLVTFHGDGHTVMQREYLPQPADLVPVERIRLALRNAHAGWYYGLHNRAVFAAAIEGVRRFRHIWGYDFIAICHMILSGGIEGDNKAVYYLRLIPVNDDAHRPRTTKDQYVHYRDFLKESFRALKAAPLGASEKAAVLPALVRYGRHGEKPQRIFKSAIKSLFFPSKRLKGPMYMRGWQVENKENRK